MTNFLYTDIIWLATTLILGFLAQRVKLPPLIGFLISGFVLNAVGITNGSFDLNELSELGVLLLLFTIGLKLDLKSIFKAEVIATSSFQVVISIVLMGTVFQVFGALGLFYFTDLSFNASLLVAFALSFSSTVFAVKALEGKGEIKSFHGKTAIGILIVQDVFAVLFLTISKGKIPSVWAFSLPLYLWMVRKLVFWYLNRAGHGELFTLFGLFLALVAGASAFDIMGLKADLGALVIGVLIAKHPRASELAKRLVDYKDLFLIGFFFQIGMLGIPTWSHLAIAFLLAIILISKPLMFFGLLTRFKFRARTAFFVGTSLATYSEFGLIVASLGQQMGWLGTEWIVIMAIAMSISFIVSSPIDTHSHRIFDYFETTLQRFELKEPHPDDEPLDLGDAEVIIFGMGRIGTAAYDQMVQHYGPKVIGLDFNQEKVKTHIRRGRNVVWGDASDSNFWRNVRCPDAKYVLLAMSKQSSNLQALNELEMHNKNLFIAATANYDDEVTRLEEAGVHYVYNMYANGGYDFARYLIEQRDNLKSKHPFRVNSTTLLCDDCDD